MAHEIPAWFLIALVFVPYCVGTAIGWWMHGIRARDLRVECEKWRSAYVESLADNIAFCARVNGHLDCIRPPAHSDRKLDS